MQKSGSHRSQRVSFDEGGASDTVSTAGSGVNLAVNFGALQPRTRSTDPLCFISRWVRRVPRQGILIGRCRERHQPASACASKQGDMLNLLACCAGLLKEGGIYETSVIFGHGWRVLSVSCSAPELLVTTAALDPSRLTVRLVTRDEGPLSTGFTATIAGPQGESEQQVGTPCRHRHWGSRSGVALVRLHGGAPAPPGVLLPAGVHRSLPMLALATSQVHVPVTGNVMHRGKGTPQLRTAVRCVGHALQDETDASDWAGFE